MEHSAIEDAEGEAPEPSARPAPAKREVLIWDDVVHEQNESSSLYFLRLSFGVDYQRQSIQDALETFYKATDISAHIAYETLGDYDLLLRLWIPRRYIIEEIENLLREHLRGTSLQEVEHIACRTKEHWAKRHQREPTLHAQSPLIVDDDLIAAVNNFNEAQFSSRKALPRPPGADKLIEQGVLIPIALNTRGIRFFVIFDRSRRSGDVSHTDILRRIKQECKAIEDTWRGTHEREPEPWPTGPHFSIYSGHGTMSDFLLMVRAPHGDFHEFVRKVVFRLRDIGLGEVYQMRPYTHVIADQMFSDFQERRVSVASVEISAATLLATERETLEFKASYAVNLRRMRSDGTRNADAKMKDNIIKAVCGFLNSPYGGTLVIGVLEVEREYAIAERQGEGDEYLKWLLERFKYSPQLKPDGTLRRPLANAPLGIEYEYSDGGPFSGPDKYFASLRDSLKSNIDPNPLPWVRLGPREIDGRSYAVISARPSDTWCYATVSTEKTAQFFVREGASTRAATGREIDLYREADPRGRSSGSAA